MKVLIRCLLDMSYVKNELKSVVSVTVPPVSLVVDEATTQVANKPHD